jgi:hypothetical protein
LRCARWRMHVDEACHSRGHGWLALAHSATSDNLPFSVMEPVAVEKTELPVSFTERLQLVIGYSGICVVDLCAEGRTALVAAVDELKSWTTERAYVPGFAGRVIRASGGVVWRKPHWRSHRL